ncbi:MAG TPA: hypothetical protein VF105_06530 [Gemmatimonadaceae bacterium]
MPPLRRNLNGRRKEETEAQRKVKVRAMDPVQMCGKGTSVTQLYRVDETLDSTRIHHLVFFDRHGWYCEHGKQCSAVKDVQQFTKHGRHGD